MPFEPAALAASPDQVLSTGVPPPSGSEGGYRRRRDAYGGIFTISVEKAIGFTFQTIGRR